MKLKELLTEFQSTPKEVFKSQARTGASKTKGKLFFLEIDAGTLLIKDANRKTVDVVELESSRSDLCNTRFRVTFKNNKGTLAFDVDVLTPKWDDVKAKATFDNLKFDHIGDGGLDVNIIDGGKTLKVDVYTDDTMVVKATNFCVDNLED